MLLYESNKAKPHIDETEFYINSTYANFKGAQPGTGTPTPLVENAFRHVTTTKPNSHNCN